LVVAPLVAVGVAFALFGLQTAEAQTFNQLELVATLKEGEISRWLRERDRDLAVLVSEPAFQQNAGRLMDPASTDAERRAAYSSLGIRLNDFLEKKVSFAELFLLDAEDGKAVVSTDVLREGISHREAEYFYLGLQGPVLRPPEFDPRLNVPIVLIARPISSPSGRVVGVLVGRVNLGDLSVLMLERTGLGQTGETYLVDPGLRAITQLRFASADQPVDTEGVHKALGYRTTGSSRYDNYQGTRVFGVYGWIPELQVALLAEQSEAEALAAIRVTLVTILGLTVAGGLLAALVVVYVSRRITRPITRLTEAATEMAAGDLSQRVAIQRPDEIGALSQAFDRMADQLAGSIGTLERRVAERTRDLERRAVQLTTAADVGRAAASILDPETLTHRVVELVRERFDLYYAGLFLLDDAGEYAVLEAGTGEAGRLMEARGHKLAFGGTSMVGAACSQRQARIALDARPRPDWVGAEPVRFDNPLLPETRSEMALPLIVGDHVLGVLDVQSAQPAAFSQEDITVLQLVADQVAVAVENARKFSAEAALLEATSPIYRTSRRLATATTTDEVADAIIATVAETGVDGCVVVGFEFSPAGEPDALLYLGVWRRDRDPQFRRGLRLPITESPFPLDMVSTLWTAANVETDERLPQNARQVFLNTGVRALANIPLRAGARIIGQVVVLRTTTGPFSASAVRIYEALSDQAAVALERARLLEVARRRVEEEAALRTISDHLAQATDVESVLRSAAEGLGQAIRAGGIYIELGPGSA
jgi:GAF domain-containing protein/HAMP domain-containing protein